MKLELADDAQRWWKLYSIHAALVAVLLGVVETVLALMHLSWVPLWVHGGLTMVIGICGAVGRVIKQDPGDAERIGVLQSIVGKLLGRAP
ncbi:protein of unknown function [Pararobbsia alpina]|uniref:DUF7940 domain-containing protein n=1 Tax=Pararobbsia alpina TaxID=621374 RepID=UPI0039A5F1F8